MVSKARMETGKLIRKPLGNPAPDNGGVHRLLGTTMVVLRDTVKVHPAGPAGEEDEAEWTGRPG